jgi:hypothetical protein
LKRSDHVREIEETVSKLCLNDPIAVHWTDITQFREVLHVTRQKYVSPAWVLGRFHSYDEESGVLVVVNCVVDGRLHDGFGIPIGCIDSIVLSPDAEIPVKRVRGHPHTSKSIRRITKRG